MTFDEAVPVSVIPGQLSLEPEWPKSGTLQRAVLELLFTYRETGVCRRTAVDYLDCYELASRIGELRALGWDIRTRRCTAHFHRRRFVEYFLPL